MPLPGPFHSRLPRRNFPATELLALGLSFSVPPAWANEADVFAASAALKTAIEQYAAGTGTHANLQSAQSGYVAALASFNYVTLDTPTLVSGREVLNPGMLYLLHVKGPDGSLIWEGANTPEDPGGAIFLNGTREAPVRLFIGSEKAVLGDAGLNSSVIFKDAHGYIGGAIAMDIGRGSMTATDTSFQNNSSELVGGAIANGGDLILTDTSFINNLGGGIYSPPSSTTTMAGVTFIGNGAAINNGGQLTVVDALFKDNVGAISNKGLAVITNATFSGNEMATIINDGDMYLTNATFSDNQTTVGGNPAGGAILNYGVLSLRDVSFTGNIAEVSINPFHMAGGAIGNYFSAAIHLNVSDSRTSLFSGNYTHGLAYRPNSNTANSIYFTRRGSLTVDLGTNALLDMRDPMKGEQVYLSIQQNGPGRWALGGANEFAITSAYTVTEGGIIPGYLEFNANSGALYLYAENEVDNDLSFTPGTVEKVAAGSLSLIRGVGAGDVIPTFYLGADATLVAGGINFITADAINLADGATLRGGSNLALLGGEDLTRRERGGATELSLNGNITLQGGLNVSALSAADTFTLHAAFSNAPSSTASLTKTGAGTVVLTGDHNYTGLTTINGGVLQIGNGGTSGRIVGDIVNNGGLAFHRGDSLTYGGKISGTGSVVKLGDGNLVFTGAHTYTGDTRVQAGSLIVSGGASITHAASNLTVGLHNGENASVVIGSGASVSNHMGVIGWQAGSTGQVSLTTGGTWTHASELRVGDSGKGTFAMTGGTVSNTIGNLARGSGSTGTATISGGTWTNTNLLVVGNQGNGNLTLSGSGLIHAPSTELGRQSGGVGTLHLDGGVLATGNITEGSGSGTVNFNGGTLRLTENQAALFSGFETGDVSTHSGGATIDTNGYHATTSASLDGNGGLTKRGAGTLTLSGDHPYTGVTLVETGGLIVNGSLTSSSLTVEHGAYLGGSGRLSYVSLFAGASLAPGNSIGTLTVESLIWEAGAMLEFELGLGTSDHLAVGDQLLKSGTGDFLFLFEDAGWQLGQTYDLVTFGSTDFTATDFGFTNSGGFDGLFSMTDSTLRFTLQSIPEPSTAMLLGVLGGGLFLCRRGSRDRS